MPDLFRQETDRNGSQRLGKRRQAQNDSQEIRGKPK